MIGEQDVRRLQSASVYTDDGEKIGGVGEVYLDDETGAAEWVTVNTGWFGTSTSFVPLNDANIDADGNVRVPYSKDKVKDAPRMAADGHLSPQDEEELYRYYGRDYARAGYREADVDDGRRVADVDDGRRVADVDVDRVDDASTMTRAEERLNVGTESVESGRVRLRKYVTTEEQTVTVPVQKEVLSIERETIDDGTARRGGIIEGDSAVEEIVLREERAVVDKETVDVERVKIGKQEVTEKQTVTEEVRKEHIDVEGDEHLRDR